MTASASLHALARAYGVETAYRDGLKRRCRPPDDTLVIVLRALGAEIDTASGAADALRSYEAGRPVIEPVAVAWNGDGTLAVRAPIDVARMEIESEASASSHTVEATATPDGAEIRLPRLPLGYHLVRIASDTFAGETLVISAPAKAPAPPRRRTWGVFAPTYAFTSSRSWGAGDLTDLGALSRWTASLGGTFVATLPLLASFLDTPFDPSPYAPVSRLFWNEMYLDVDRVPELGASREAQHAVAAANERLDELRRSRIVDHRAVMTLKRSVLEPCAAAVDGRRRDELERHLSATPELGSYAAFRAEAERRGAAWTEWSPNVAVVPDATDPVRRYHAYVQWLMSEQLGGLGAGLYLDLPLGVHGGGFDTWRYPDSFATGVGAGAPPDTFFTRGQSWGSPPLHPTGLRRTGYEYPIACVRNLMRYASVLRIDHVMSMHRLFWIPSDGEPSDGTYVRYPAEEMYAIVTLEAHRAGVVVAGEDLGAVPPAVRPAMSRHGLLRSYVLQEEIRPDVDAPLRRAPRLSVCSPNTHDMPTFASFWAGDDIDERVRDGVHDPDEAEAEAKRRAAKRDALLAALREASLIGRGAEAAPDDVLAAALKLLAASPSAMMTVALEDLWLETEPQNRPGTGAERRNWSRKAARSIDDLVGSATIAELLGDVDAIRTRRT